MEGSGQKGAAQALSRSWFREYRMLIVVYAVGLSVGVREFVVSREKEPFVWLSPHGEVLMHAMQRLDADDPDTQYIVAMHSLARGDQQEFQRLLDQLLADDVKHNELLLKFHAEYLLASGADQDRVNTALNRWRSNFPFSAEFLSIRLPAGPTTAQQATLLEHSLTQIPWVADSRLERIVDGSEARWEVKLMFRRGRQIDLGDLDDAVGAALAS
jgi:hypothetical protein